MSGSNNNPIAIIGIGCRFPGGASGPKAFWKMLCEGRDAIIDVPPDRWDFRRFYDADPDKPGKTYAKQAGFLKERIDLFDPMFFGISPREAETLDPQQRLLLEVTWEAFEDAGLIPESLAGSKTGVFIGGFFIDNAFLQAGMLNQEIADSHTATSSSLTMLSNRISYVFDLKGPSLTMDTACSSSLVSTHYACQSIRNEESDLAIAGGANVMLRPEFPVVLSKGRFLSTHSRSMAFDERAEGYARGEGAGVVLLKPLSRALQDKDPIYALIRMSGVNQDGKTTGISLPNADSQMEVMRKVYKQSGVCPGDVDYVEAHGTGTQAGDVAEMNALQAVLSEGRKDQEKCFVGSVKTNIGHLEAGAGIAGLIKAILCLKNKKIPPNLHFERPNPKIPFEDLCLKVPTKVESWPSGRDMAYVAVNSFGYGGTNAHVLLQEAPLQDQPQKDYREEMDRPLLIPISAKSENALKELAGKYAFALTADDVSLADFTCSTSFHRTHHNHRLAVVAQSEDDLREKLLNFSMGEMERGMFANQAVSGKKAGPVFVYTGMGPQWWAMGKELRDKEPVFRDALTECDVLFREIFNWSVINELDADEKSSRIAETEMAQRCNFAIQVALTTLWESWGIKPGAVVGHSVGEVSAAYTSGALSFEDAVRVSYHRSRLQQSRAGLGTMLAVGLPEADASELIKGYDRVSIGAINSPYAFTLSGDEEELRGIAETLEKEGVFNRFLRVEVAYHSYQMDPIREELLECLKGIEGREAKIPLYSTVFGEPTPGTEWGAPYWWKNVRLPVRFADSINSLLSDGYKHFVEVGPHPVLGTSIKECAILAEVTAHLIPSLYRNTPELLRMLESLGQLYALGYQVNWKNIVPGNGRYVSLPTYPWQREQYWKESEQSRESRLGSPGHVLFNNDLRAPQPAWAVEINEHFFPYLWDHKVQNNVVFPGAAYVEAGLALHAKLFSEEACILKDMEFKNMLMVEPKENQMLSVSFDPQSKSFFVDSRAKGDGTEWTRHALGKIVTNAVGESRPNINPRTIKSHCQEDMTVKELYNILDRRGLHYGKYFQTVKEIKTNKDECLLRIEMHSDIKKDKDTYLLHPTILDATFQSVLSLITGSAPYVPVSIKHITFYGSPGYQCSSWGRVTYRTNRSFKADITIFDEDGNIFIDLDEVFCQAIEKRTEENDWFYEFEWEQTPNPEASYSGDPQHWLIFSNSDTVVEPIVKFLSLQDFTYTIVSFGGKYCKENDILFRIRRDSKTDIEQILKDMKTKKIDAMLYLWSLDNGGSGGDIQYDETLDQCMQVVHLVQSWNQINPDQSISLGIVTRDAQIVQLGDKGVSLAVAPLWGLGQLIENEYANIRCKLIDLDPGTTHVDEKALITEWISDNEDRDIALRSGKRFVKRLTKSSLKENNPVGKIEQLSTAVPLALATGYSRRLERFYWKETVRRPPGAGEVEIKVHSTSLNFKDLMKAQKRLSHKVTEGTYTGTTLGVELSGKIAAVGEGVTQFRLGDMVTAIVGGSFRSYMTIPATYVIPKPSTLSLHEAHCYVVFLAAYYGLVDLARLEKGERILIHNATGGLGLAAMQIARWKDAEIFATAGSQEKREYLRSQGIRYVMNSRTLEFAGQIRQATHNKGVDVVISAVAGDALDQTVSILAPYGRFIEVGHVSIAGIQGLPLDAFNKNQSFFTIDIDRMLKDRPPLAERLIKEIHRRFEEGSFGGLPFKAFAARDVSDAFNFMARSKHIGKIVVTIEDEEVPAVPLSEDKLVFRGDGTYLVTGGNGGFGMEVARWLACNGAGHLILASRKGAVSNEARQGIDDMKKAGAQVISTAVDITDRSQIKKLIQESKANLPPLRGIFHCAMVLDDGLLSDLDEERFSNVMAPKVAGALNLHKYTKDLPLDYFISFSSISSIIGNRGQANYVAANAFLDAFAHYRRSQGLPATTINWGVFAETGVAARHTHLIELFQSSGIAGYTTEQALWALERVLENDPVQIGVFAVDWSRWSEINTTAPKASRFQRLVKTHSFDQNGEGIAKKEMLLEELNALNQEERQHHMDIILCEQIAHVLRSPVNKIDTHQGLDKLGIDSLMALELALAFKTEYGITISAEDMIKQQSISQLSSKILGKLLPFSNQE